MNISKYLPKINISKYLPMINLNYINLNLLPEPTDNWRIQGYYLDELNHVKNKGVPYHKQYECRDFNYDINKVTNMNKNKNKNIIHNKLVISDKFKKIPRNQQYEYQDF